VPQFKNSNAKPLKIIWPIVYVGAAIGLVLSWSVISGDQLGRINLFYLLVVYLVIPLLSIITSVFSVFFGKGINLARLLTTMPVWTSRTKSMVRKVHQLNLDKYWFLMQSQLAAIAFSVASLLVFFTLLLATDLNFVWRSTILLPADIFPILEVIAMPWQFWSAAQPELTLLEMTQDSRIVPSSNGFSEYGAWWQFIFATQLCYSFLLRVLLLLGTRWRLKKMMASDVEQRLQHDINQHDPLHDEEQETSPILNQIPEPELVINWDNIDMTTLAFLKQHNLADEHAVIHNRQSISQLQSEEFKQTVQQLLIVKGWEGPMGELEDYLAINQGYLLPLDWNDSGLTPLQFNHLHEWQRLVNKYSSWQLYLPQELQP